MTIHNIFTASHIHLVGIKGVAMTSLAQCLLDINKTVTGSDVSEDFVTKKILAKLDIQMTTGFSPEDIPPDTDLLIYTGAHRGSQNPQVVSAKVRGIPVLSHAEALGELMAQKQAISVCGTGGKSTTSAMLAWIFQKTKTDISYAVGVGNIPGLERTGQYQDSSTWFVAEADEYAVDPMTDHRPRFIFQHPKVTVCTSLAYDHPDIYPDFEATKQVFSQFFQDTEDAIYVNADAQELKTLFTSLRDQELIHNESCSVGFNEAADYRLTLHSSTNGKTLFSIQYEGFSERQPFLHEKQTWEGELCIPGKHNVINACLAILAARAAGISFEESLTALRDFQGTMRRFEYKGSLHGVHCFDDYAHTPDEIHVTLEALRSWEPNKKIVVAFQPHTYSRTKALFDGFVQSLANADEVWLLDIFASAREQEDKSVSSKLLAQELQKFDSHCTVKTFPTIDSLAVRMRENLTAGSVFISMGAGDIYVVYEGLEMESI